MDNNNVTANNSMSSFIDNYSKQENAIKNSTAATEQQNRINTSLWFYEQSYNPTTAVEIRNQQHNASRAWKLASLIAEYWANNWVTVTWSDTDIINKYIANLPESVRWRVAERFADYTHSTEYIENSNNFALEMWWRTKDFWDYIWDAAKWVYDYVMYWPYKLWGWLRKLSNTANVAWNKENNQESYDVMNLAQERFWPLAWIDGYLSDEDWNDLQFEVDNNSASLDRQHNLSNIALDIWVWAVLSTVSVLAPKTNLAIWLASQLWGTWDILEWANDVAWDLWTVVNKAPVLSQYKNSLEWEEAKSEFDYFVGNMIIWWILGTMWKYKTPIKNWIVDNTWSRTKWGNNWKWWWTPTVESQIKNGMKELSNNITADEIIKVFEQTKELELANKNKNLILDEILWEKLWDALKKDWYDYDAIKDSIDRLDKQDITSLKDLKEWLKTQKKHNINKVNSALEIQLESDKLPIWKDNIMDWTKEKFGKGYDFITEEIKLLEWIEEENILDGSTSKNLDYLKNVQEKYNKWEITNKDIIDLQRYASREVSIYKNKAWDYNTEMKWDTASKIRQARENAIEFVKDRLNSSYPWRWDTFWELERAIHNDIIAEEYIEKREIERRVKNSKNTYRWEWSWTLWSSVKQFSSKVSEWLRPSVKWTIMNIWKKILWIGNMDIMEVDWLLHEMLQNYDFLNEVLWNKKKIKAFENKVEKLTSVKDKIINERLKNVEESVNKDANTQEPLLDLSQLTYEYTQWLSEILEDLWATKEEANIITSTMQQSLFDF